MQPVSVICSYSASGKIRPLYFGTIEEEQRHTVRVEEILRVSNVPGYKNAYYAGTTIKYLDKCVFECRCHLNDKSKILLLIYNPVKLMWYMEH